MKYLKKFTTENEKMSYLIKNDLISYVKETDKVYVNGLTKIASFMFTVQDDDFADSEQDRWWEQHIGFALSNVYSTPDSNIDVAFMGGKPLDLSLVKNGLKYGTDLRFVKIPLSEGEQEVTPDGKFVYSVATTVNFDDESFGDLVDAWFDLENKIVRNVSDNSQVVANCISETGFPSGQFQLFVDEFDTGFGNQLIVYIMFDSHEEFMPSYEKRNSDYVIGSQYLVELYSFDKEIIFDHAKWLPYSQYTHYTLSKNVSKIEGGAFANAWYTDSYGLKEIWYEGTIAEFNEIEKGNNWKGKVSVVHCTDGDLSV